MNEEGIGDYRRNLGETSRALVMEFTHDDTEPIRDPDEGNTVRRD